MGHWNGLVRRSLAVALAAGMAVVTSAAIGAGLAGTAGASVPDAAKLPKGPRIDPSKPCSLLSQRQVESVFDPKVTLDATNAESPVGVDCAWVVGDEAAPVGRLVGLVVYPVFGGDESDAVNLVESDRANAQLAGPGVVDLPLGKGGFIEKARSLVEVAPSKKFAFSLQWFPAGGAPEGSPITAEMRALLSKLAADVAKRGKQVD